MCDRLKQIEEYYRCRLRQEYYDVFGYLLPEDRFFELLEPEVLRLAVRSYEKELLALERARDVEKGTDEIRETLGEENQQTPSIGVQTA